MEDVAVRAGHEALIVVDLYFIDCWWSTRDFKPVAQALVHFLNIIVILISYYIIKLLIYAIYKNEDHPN